MIANCVCDTSILESSSENNITENIGNEKEGFNSVKKSIIASLIDCNFEVFKCYNIILTIRIISRSNIS